METFIMAVYDSRNTFAYQELTATPKKAVKIAKEKSKKTGFPVVLETLNGQEFTKYENGEATEWSYPAGFYRLFSY